MLKCYSTYYYTTEKHTSANKMFYEKDTNEIGLYKLQVEIVPICGLESKEVVKNNID